MCVCGRGVWVGVCGGEEGVWLGVWEGYVGMGMGVCVRGVCRCVWEGCVSFN